jgi:glycine/D-amino acid oxidase-like deaminating enzyme
MRLSGDASPQTRSHSGTMTIPVSSEGQTPSVDAVVIGGGMIGCSIALYLRKFMPGVRILERSGELLGGASYSNQARVHNGYHYPRSFLTALRSRVNYPRFLKDYDECVDRSFTKYYAVGRNFSHVTAEQFVTFCRRIGAPVAAAPPAVKKLFSASLVEDVFAVEECAFDATLLRDRLAADLARVEVDVRTGAEAVRVAPAAGGGLLLSYREDGVERELRARYVFNCTYARLNDLLRDSDLPTIPLRHELTEMALVEVPEVLRELGITIMCGPFFSLMPFPARKLHTLSHVRYTPHGWWEERAGGPAPPHSRTGMPPLPTSHFPQMLRDAQRYLPAAGDCVQAGSIWEMKTVLPSSEVNDSRPILFKRDCGLENLTCVLGGKIDNIYDALVELELMRSAGRLQ